MRVLGLDLSKKSGWALLEDSTLVSYGLVKCFDNKLAFRGVSEDFMFIQDSLDIANHIRSVVTQCPSDFIYIEQTNKGRNRTSQKQLEFIHYSVLAMLDEQGLKEKVRYTDTSAWRMGLGIRMSKEDTQHNKQIKARRIRGKKTIKHVTLRWVNERYDLSLIVKDNDMADAISIASHGMNLEQKAQARAKSPKAELNISDIFK